jgi:predicted enzyme related to lactoylglutathione lyase
MVANQPGMPALWTVSLKTADAAAPVVLGLGGTRLAPVTDSPFGRMTHPADPTGALLTIIQVM